MQQQIFLSPIIVALIVISTIMVATFYFMVLKQDSPIAEKLRKKNYIVYYVLASIDIITICISLYLNHSLMQLHQASIDINLMWANRRDNLIELSEMATKVNAPGNNVFETHNVKNERRMRDQEHRRFEKRLGEIRDDLKFGTDHKQLNTILIDINNIERSMHRMLDEQNTIFELIRKKQYQAAGSKMALMDRKYADLTTTINTLNLLISDIQNNTLMLQKSQAEDLKVMEYVLGVIILLIVCIVAIYGHQLSTQTTRDLEEQKNWYRRMMYNYPGASIIINNQGIITGANNKALELLNYAEGALNGKSINNVMEQNFKYHPEKSLNTFLNTITGIKKDNPVQIITSTGSKVPVEVSKSMIEIKNEKLYEVMFVDITDRIKLEQAKSELISIFSHEVRTPLTAITGAISLLRKVSKDNLSQRTYLFDTAESNCRRLTQLANSMLDIEQLCSGKVSINRQTIELCSLIQKVKAAMEKCHAAKHIHFVIESAPSEIYMETDTMLLEQIITQLVSNSIKFSPPESKINIVAEAFNDTVQIKVIDFGEGIPDEYESKLFERFTQANMTSTRNQEGGGLGLAVSHDMVKALGGTIHFEKNPEGGSIFVVKLPRELDIDSPTQDAI